ncbi:MAG: type II CRISPR-associated endonuclease Cas1 [Desulfobulbaceae bacterium]|nr:type II CRISPR-associated endonuclease Cas1 [Desulfobulbaceae bacterium]
MIKRIVDISDRAYVRLNAQQLLIEKAKEIVGRIPVEDLGVLILDNPAIVMTQAAIVACQKNNVVVVFCDEKHLPYSLTLPISDAHSLHHKVLRQQIEISVTTQKRLWQQIVRHKIRRQAQTLLAAGGNSRVLENLAGRVKSGDRENHESQAAQLYWRLLMGDNFRRQRDAEGVNALLNYGYSVIRAAVARAIVGGGLHPALGIHHHNQYNGFCLADDLMEPFRPWVDLVVYRLREDGRPLEINKQSKQLLLGMLGGSVIWKGSAMPLMVAMHYLIADFKLACLEKGMSLEYPTLQEAGQS